MKTKFCSCSQYNYLSRTIIRSGKAETFENRRGKYKDNEKYTSMYIFHFRVLLMQNSRHWNHHHPWRKEAYLVYVEDTFLPCDAVIARIFSKEMTGMYYYVARYLDPKYSRWLSGDPALGAYIPAAGEDISKLPAGGIFTVISFNLFNYANNNPIYDINIYGSAQLKRKK